MNISKSISRAWVCGLAGICLAAEQAPMPVKDSPEVVSLPLPGGVGMEFSLIRVSDRPDIFASREFNMGATGDAEKHDTTLTPTSVSGTLYVPRGADSGDWVIPMATTEVTCAQFAAVTGRALDSSEQANKPKVKITALEVQQFMEALSRYLLDPASPACKKLTAMGSPAQLRKHSGLYARLPFEREWEFAARGAVYVSPAIFQNPIPYASRELLIASENVHVNGRTVLRDVKSRMLNHPCKLHDMLGNAMEIVQGNYQPEYHYGRIGGVLLRGGAYNTDVDQATSFYRSELPAYDEYGEAASSGAVGFRVVLGSDILVPAVLGETLTREWQQHATARFQGSPSSKAGSSMDADINRKINDVTQQLQMIFSQMNAGSTGASEAGSTATLDSQLGLIQSQIKSMQTRVQNAANALAFSGLLVSDEYNENAVNTMLRKLAAEQAIKTVPEKSLAGISLRKTIDATDGKMDAYWDKVGRGFAVMAQADETSIQTQIEQRRKELTEQSASQSRMQAFEMLVAQFRKYQQTGSLASQEQTSWEQELQPIAAHRMSENQQKSAASATAPKKNTRSASPRRNR